MALRRQASRPESRHGGRRELRRFAARGARARARVADARSHTSSTAAFKAATSRATTAIRGTTQHAVQLEMCWHCYMREEPPYAWDEVARRARATAAALARADDARLETDMTAAHDRACGRRTHGCSDGWHDDVLLEIGADGRWADGDPERAPGPCRARRCSPDRSCPVS